MKISFTCPRCGAALNAPDAYAGGRARCASCGNSVRIPKTQDGTNEPAPRQPAPTEPKTPSSTTAGRGGSANPMGSSVRRSRNAVLITVIILLPIGFAIAFWPRAATRDVQEANLSSGVDQPPRPVQPNEQPPPPRYFTWKTVADPHGGKSVKYYGIMDRSGTEIVPYKFRAPVFFSEGLAVIDEGLGRYGYIDVDGDWAIPPELVSGDYTADASFKEGRARIGSPGTEGFIDSSGRTVIESKWVVISDFAEGLAAVVGDEGGAFFIDPQGVPVMRLPPETIPVGSFSDGLVPVREGPASYGYMNRAGQVVLRIPDAESIRGFSEGLAAAQVHGKFGYVNRNGEYAIAPTHDDAREFSEGVAAIESDGKWGYIGKDGTVLVTPQYDWASEFSEGYAVVTEGESYGFVDSKGHELTMACEFALPFDSGLALCTPYGWFDHSGRFVWVSPDVRDRKIESLDDLPGDPLEGLPKPVPRPPLFTREDRPTDNE